MENLFFDDYSAVRELTDNYKSVFIDTGENGIFSRADSRQSVRLDKWN